MLAKLKRSLTEDVAPLLPAGVRYGDGDALEAFGRVWTQLIMRMRGESWKLSGKVIAQLRETKYPGLLRDSGAGASG